MEEALRDLAVNKHGFGFVRMGLFGRIDDDSPAARDRWARNLDDMRLWVMGKKFADPVRIGFFAYEPCAEGILRSFVNENSPAFSIVTLDAKARIDLNTKIPTLFLQGSANKVSLEAVRLSPEDMLCQSNAETKSSRIQFKGSDDYLYNVHKQAADKIMEWLKTV
jgi:hypothetical protein